MTIKNNYPMHEFDMNSLVNVVNQTAVNTKSVSEQLGIISSAIIGLKTHASETDQKLEDIGQRMTGWEQRERISVSEARRIQSAVKAKCYALLGIEHDGGVVAVESIPTYKRYFGKFCRRCYLDARNKSRLGNPYYDTRKQDLNDVMTYIQNWEPEVQFDGKAGTEAYKSYLDAMNEGN